ncbi:MAG: ABC transporter ATP-binding protein [Candidatus Limiplasma sp.]|nr:ABC transporter ATP-binding protein [Candidatus Limiplasma sp.]
MEEKLLSIRDLSVQYHTDEATVQAVSHVSLQLRKKETLGLVGETGAGKTTLALSVMRLLPKGVGEITGGEVLFEGKDLLKASDAEMRAYRGKTISMIFQDPMTSLNPVIPVGKQVAEILELHNTRHLSREQIERRVDEMFELVGIPPYRKNEYPHQFSGGMKQRGVIAVSLALNPELLIADEPTTALDVTIQAQVLAMMEDIKQKLDTSMIMITHDLGIIAEMCDTVAVMYAGEIVESGSVEDIFEGKRHHPYTVGLFGSIPKLTGETRRLQPIEGMIADPSNLPEGCKFHPRCAHCTGRCKREQPGAHTQNGHMIRCHLYDEEDRA